VRFVPGRPRREIALSFDDGPGPSTRELLSSLEGLDAPATFFVVGARVAGRSAEVAAIAAAGHELGSHSWSHARLAGRPLRAWRELARSARAISASGAPRPRLFRPPYLSWSASLAGATALARMVPVGWDVDPRDWEAEDAEEIVNRVYAGASGGSIVLLHDRADCRATLEALPSIVGGLRDLGLRLVTVSRLLGADFDGR
jgi:peptidoglycan/xylan/chitin deacetylase (PgdA/CDA1 family)